MTVDTLERPPSGARPPPRRPFKHLGAMIGGVIVLAIIVFLLLFRWDWLRPPLAHLLSARLHRPVKILGHLEVHPWSWSPQATVHDVEIADAPWTGATTPMISLPRFTAQVKLLPLLSGKVILPLVRADQPSVRLLRDAQGRTNWQFGPKKAHPTPLKLPAINTLILDGGRLSFRDVKRRIDFTGRVSTTEQVIGHGRGSFIMDGAGTLNGERFLAHVTGGPLINVDPNRPYPFDAHVESGPTRVRLQGHIAHPFNFGQINGLFSVSGADLADLYDLTGIVFPNSPPYALSAGFGRDGEVYALRHLKGRLGGSDLEGALTIDHRTSRPLLTGDLSSRLVRLDDLTAVVGGAPRRGHAQGGLSPLQQKVSARLSAEHSLFPDTHLDVSRVRAMDARVRYHAAAVAFGKLPVKQLAMTVKLDHGVLDLAPLDLTLPQGRLSGTVRLDARRNEPTEAIDLRLTDARVENVALGKKAGPPPIAGALAARLKIASHGDSIRATARNADGAATFVVTRGEMRQSLAELLGINVANGLVLLLEKSKQDTPLNCAVLDMRGRNGVFTADRLVLDTGVTLVHGQGDIDLRTERMDFVLNGKPKKFRLLRIAAPITVRGPLAGPKVGVQVVKALPQVAGSVALGVLAAPVAAILPLVGLGSEHNADCAGLVEAAASGPAPVKARPPAPPPPKKHFHLF